MFPRNIRNRMALGRAYLSRRSRLGAFPFEVAIGITNRCNLDCKFCPQRSSRRPRGNIALDFLDFLLDQASSYVDAVDLSFDGEPFLHPRWVECIEACHRHGLQAILQTNALLLDDSLAREILAVGVDSITFSIDAVSAETYRLLKTGGDYERVVENVECFLRHARRRRKRPHIIIQFVRGPENAHEERAFIDRWRAQGADLIRIKPMLNFGGSIGSPPRVPPNKPCILLWTSIAVHWDGIVPLCCMEIEGRTRMADAGQQPLRSIIDNSAFIDVRRLHLAGRAREHPVCRNCDIPAVAWPLVVGSTLVGDFVRRKLINFFQGASLLRSRKSD